MMMIVMMMIFIIPKKRTANENAARISVDQQPKDITYFSYKNPPPPPVVGVWDYGNDNLIKRMFITKQQPVVYSSPKQSDLIRGTDAF